jgi:hypothetical protein
MSVAARLSALILGAVLSVSPTFGSAQSVAPMEPTIRPVARVVPTASPEILAAINPEVRPTARNAYLPRTRWDTIPNGRVWTCAALSAPLAHGAGIEDVVPRDIATWRPA